MLLIVVGEAVDIAPAVMDTLLVKLPWPSYKYVASLHGDDITLDLIRVLTNSERHNNLFGYLELSLIIEPLESVWFRMGSFGHT